MTSRERILQKLKLDPKIRMVANGDEVVNALRAEQSASVAVIDEQLLEDVPMLREPEARSLLRDELPKAVRRGRLKGQTQAIYVNVFVELREGADELPTPLAERPNCRPCCARRILSAQPSPSAPSMNCWLTRLWSPSRAPSKSASTRR